MRTLIIVPTFNEAGNIAAAIERIHTAAPGVDILVVDDMSPDGTGEIADRLAEADDRISVMHRQGKRGLGPAYLAGFAHGIESGYDLLVEMDADGSHPADALPRMIGRLSAPGSEAYGGVIGSRWVDGGSVVNWPKSREAISRVGSWYARLMLGVKVKDVTAGYRVYRAAVLDSVGLENVESQGYCFQIDLTRRVLATGAKLVEEPIEFREREVGESKMSRAIVLEAMGRVTIWGLERAWDSFGRVFRR